MTTKTLIYFIGILTLLFTFSSCTSAPVQLNESKLELTSEKLKLLDLDQMTELVQAKVQSYKKTGSEMRIAEAIIISLARPNDDGLAEKLMDTVRFSLESSDTWEAAMIAAVDNSIKELQSGTAAAEDQITHLILLENLVAEYQPQFLKQYQGPKFETQVIEKIAEAKISVTDEAAAEGRLNMMKEPVSPSTLAQSLIDARTKKLNPEK